MCSCTCEVHHPTSALLRVSAAPTWDDPQRQLVPGTARTDTQRKLRALAMIKRFFGVIPQVPGGEAWPSAAREEALNHHRHPAFRALSSLSRRAPYSAIVARVHEAADHFLRGPGRAGGRRIPRWFRSWPGRAARVSPPHDCSPAQRDGACLAARWRNAPILAGRRDPVFTPSSHHLSCPCPSASTPPLLRSFP